MDRRLVLGIFAPMRTDSWEGGGMDCRTHAGRTPPLCKDMAFTLLQRELDTGSRNIIKMQTLEKGSKTWVTNPLTDEMKEFKFDFSFQSSSPDEQGIGDYASQV